MWMVSIETLSHNHKNSNHQNRIHTFQISKDWSWRYSFGLCRPRIHFRTSMVMRVKRFFQPQTQGLRFDLMNYSHELQRRNAAARTMMGPWDRCSVRCTNVDGTAGSSWRSWRSWRYSQKLSPVEAVKVGDGFVVKASLVSFLCTASSCFFRAIWARLERFNASSPLQRWQNSHALPL